MFYYIKVEETKNLNDEITFPVKTTFKTGYENVSDIPSLIQVGLLQYIAYMYENRGDCCKIECPESILNLFFDSYKFIEV